MNSFSIRDIENLCGIKAHTLRVWEQRYQLLCPKRGAGNHRTYTNEDLKYLLRIAYLYRNGHKVSALAKLSEKEICALAMESARSGPEMDGDLFINQLMEASLDFDQQRFDKILHNIILHLGFEKCITQVAFPFLTRMGLLWLTGNVVPAQEHFASALVTKKIFVAINGLEPPPSDTEKKVLIYSPREEFHELPLLYMRYLMKKNRISTVYLGKNIGVDELQYYCTRKPATHLYFHLVTNLIRCEPDQYVSKLAGIFPDKEIVISGCLAQTLRTAAPNVRILKSLEDMQKFAGE